MGFPSAGNSVCIPEACAIYTIQENDTCYSIVQANNYTFTVTQLISWNGNINRDCSNLDQLVASQICISSPEGGVPAPTGSATTTVAPIPTDIAAGTNTQCAKYYLVSAGDDCSRITVMLGISLEDFYFLNPEVNSTNCNNLEAGYSYCVQAVGNINTYSGYGGTTSRQCIVNGSIAASCLATTTVATDTYWSFPAPTNATTTSVISSTPLPVAPGTPTDCDGYEIYSNLTTNSTSNTPNTCAFIAWYAGLPIDELLELNPSLSYNTSNPSACVLEQGYRYCLLPSGGLSSATATPTATATATGTASVTPAPVQTGMVSNCTDFYYVISGDDCYDIAQSQGISLSDFYSWNPAVGNDCRGLQADYYVCVGVNSSSSSTPSATATTTTSTSTGNGVTTPTPTQSGMTNSCTTFYLVQSGDGCWAIANNHSISLDDFYAWNPAVGDDCSTLQPDYYVCVGVISSSSSSSSTPTITTTTSTTTSSTGNGVTTPTPTQDGMTTSCTKFYLVQSGDGCYDLAQSEGIALSDFYAWNPAVKDDCSGLQANVYVCVGVSSSSTTTTTTPPPSTTSSGNGVATPSPIQNGMTTSCGTFYLVQSGDGCWAIANSYSIALADFYSWNPAVGDDCSGLQANVYVCVGLIA